MLLTPKRIVWLCRLYTSVCPFSLDCSQPAITLKSKIWNHSQKTDFPNSKILKFQTATASLATQTVRSPRPNRSSVAPQSHARNVWTSVWATATADNTRAELPCMTRRSDLATCLLCSRVTSGFFSFCIKIQPKNPWVLLLLICQSRHSHTK